MAAIGAGVECLRAREQEAGQVEREALVGLLAGIANRVYVVATMRENDVVRVNWDRSGNAAEVVFMFETRGAEGPWVHAASVTRTQALLRGVSPGVETWFRVRATKGGSTAPPSGLAVLYRASEGRAARAAA